MVAPKKTFRRFGPADPPFAVLGLPRVVNNEADLCAIVARVGSPANGICFCAGSLRARADHDLPGMVDRLGHRVHVFHLRSTQCNADGSFCEAGHVEGSVGLFARVKAGLVEMNARRDFGCRDRQIVFRPDHGRRMLDDLTKAPLKTSGYHGIGRWRGLSEFAVSNRGFAANGGLINDCSVRRNTVDYTR